MPVARKNDIEAALERLDPAMRRVLVAGMGRISYGAKRLCMRYSTYRDDYSRAIEEMVEVLNTREANTMPKTNGNAGERVGDLPKGPAPDERELYAAFDALEQKLTKLNGLPWRSATIARTADGFRCSVTV